MTIDDISEKLFHYVEYTFYMHESMGFTLRHDLGTVLESSDGVYLIGNYFQGDVAKGVELAKFLSFFNHTKILNIDLGAEVLAYIFKLHDFKDDYR